MNGRSQAVRLPQEFRFDTDRVGIRREGCNVILCPIYEGWEDFFEHAPQIGGDFVRAMSSARRDLMPIEDRESLDNLSQFDHVPGLVIETWMTAKRS